MIVHPNPFVWSVVARQRHEELLAEADRYRSAQRATGDEGPRWRWPALPTVVAVIAILWLLAAAAAAA